jgi:plastocyanin
VFDNEDASTAHNIRIFGPGGASLANSDVETGPAAQTISLGVLVQGTYNFVCDVHALKMKGVLTIS